MEHQLGPPTCRLEPPAGGRLEDTPEEGEGQSPDGTVTERVGPKCSRGTPVGSGGTSGFTPPGTPKVRWEEVLVPPDGFVAFAVNGRSTCLLLLLLFAALLFCSVS